MLRMLLAYFLLPRLGFFPGHSWLLPHLHSPLGRLSELPDRREKGPARPIFFLSSLLGLDSADRGDAFWSVPPGAGLPSREGVGKPLEVQCSEYVLCLYLVFGVEAPYKPQPPKQLHKGDIFTPIWLFIVFFLSWSRTEVEKTAVMYPHDPLTQELWRGKKIHR